MITCKYVNCGKRFGDMGGLTRHKWTAHPEMFANKSARAAETRERKKAAANRAERHNEKTKVVVSASLGEIQLQEIERTFKNGGVNSGVSLDEAINALRIDHSALNWAFGTVISRLTAMRQTGRSDHGSDHQ